MWCIIGVRAGKFLGLRMIFARISPNLPETFTFLSQRSWRPFFGMISIKKGLRVFFYKLWAPFLRRFSGILPIISGILSGFSTNWNFWGCACDPSSYTIVFLNLCYNVGREGNHYFEKQLFQKIPPVVFHVKNNFDYHLFPLSTGHQGCAPSVTSTPGVKSNDF